MPARPAFNCRLATVFVPAAIALAACGGSDDPPAAEPPPAAATLKVGGTAATGAAIGGAVVQARCAAGTGAATTSASGSYSIEMAGASLPCLLRVTAADGTELHSLASEPDAGSNDSATANITPVSELVVAQLGGQSPADFFATFDAAAAGALGAAAVQQAVDHVVEVVKAAGIDLSGVGHVLSAPLVAAAEGNPGNDFDQKLDALMVQLEASGTSLASVATSVARSSPAALPGARTGVVSPAAEMLLRPAAPNCSALRSGTYRLVFLAPGEGGAAFTDTMTVDAAALTATGSSGEATPLLAAGACRYTLPEGGELVVSAAGVGVLRSAEAAGLVAGLAFPEQRHAVSVTQGAWNYMGLADGALALGAFTVDDTGRTTSGRFCDSAGICEEGTPDERETFVAHAEGGFSYDGGRAFAFRSGGGEVMLVALSPDGAFALATRKAPTGLPPVGRLSRSWNFTVTPQYTVPFALSVSENTTVSHAEDGSSWRRDAVIDFAAGTTRPETVRIDMPFEGFIHRLAETVTTSSGGSSNVPAWIGLSLRGIGVTPVGLPDNQRLILSVGMPTP
ncbi:MAG TPA: hypothetical protein VK876_03910 [Rubrivivax sp.]|nr:hypothetical protein [Rubrivivax sp.]